MSIGTRIRNKREELGISQTDLAYKVGVSKQTLYKYENDIITNIPSDVIERISFYLDCTPAYLMGWEEIPHLHPDYIIGDTLIESNIRNDKGLMEILPLYFGLPDEKKRYVCDLIKMLAQ